MKTNNQNEPLVNLKDLAIDSLTKYFEGGKTEKEKDEARMALGTLGAVGRLLATDRVKDTTQLSVIEAITDDPTIKEAYVKATLPGYYPKKLLE